MAPSSQPCLPSLPQKDDVGYIPELYPLLIMCSTDIMSPERTIETVRISLSSWVLLHVKSLAWFDPETRHRYHLLEPNVAFTKEIKSIVSSCNLCCRSAIVSLSWQRSNSIADQVPINWETLWQIKELYWQKAVLKGTVFLLSQEIFVRERECEPCFLEKVSCQLDQWVPE